MESSTLYSGLILYENVSEDIEEIQSLIANSHFEWTEAKVLQSRLAKYGTDYDHKKIRDASVTSIGVEVDETEPDYVKRLSQLFNKAFDACGFDFLEKNSIPFSHREGEFALLRYNKGQFILPHIDYAEERPRKITIIFYPNDDYEGGELEFPTIGISLKPKANSLVVFLAEGEDYRHASSKIVSGAKYAVVSLWY